MCQQFIGGVLEAEGININIPETLLRLACTDCDGKGLNKVVYLAWTMFVFFFSLCVEKAGARICTTQ